MKKQPKHAALPPTPTAGPCVRLNALLAALGPGDATGLLDEAKRQRALGAELGARGMTQAAEECAAREVIMATAGALASIRG